MMGKIISRAPVQQGWTVGTGAHGARRKTEGELPRPRRVRKDPPIMKRGRPAGNPGSTQTIKFIMTVSPEDFSDIATKAIERNMGVQQYIRSFIIPAWRESE